VGHNFGVHSLAGPCLLAPCVEGAQTPPQQKVCFRCYLLLLADHFLQNVIFRDLVPITFGPGRVSLVGLFLCPSGCGLCLWRFGCGLCLWRSCCGLLRADDVDDLWFLRELLVSTILLAVRLLVLVRLSAHRSPVVC
jgi:hypothetical protein